MMLRYGYLSTFPQAFYVMTGLKVAQFDALIEDVLPKFQAAEQKRLTRRGRQRAIGGGHPFELDVPDQFLLVIVWLRRYPIHEVLGFFFGVSDSTVSRLIDRLVPILEAAGRDTMRMPDPGKAQRKQLDALLQATPDLAVVIDSFEQRVQRPRKRRAADALYSGKKKQHTLKSQVTVDETTGQIVDISESVPGPTGDFKLLERSGVLNRLPPGVGALGDLAYVGIDKLHPHGLGAAPRRKPRSQPRPKADVDYNRAFSRRRIVVEHSIGRLRHYQALTQMDRHHRRRHTLRVRAVAGLVNRRLGHRNAR